MPDALALTATCVAVAPWTIAGPVGWLSLTVATPFDAVSTEIEARLLIWSMIWSRWSSRVAWPVVFGWLAASLVLSLPSWSERSLSVATLVLASVSTSAETADSALAVVRNAPAALSASDNSCVRAAVLVGSAARACAELKKAVSPPETLLAESALSIRVR